MFDYCVDLVFYLDLIYCIVVFRVVEGDVGYMYLEVGYEILFFCCGIVFFVVFVKVGEGDIKDCEVGDLDVVDVFDFC